MTPTRMIPTRSTSRTRTTTTDRRRLRRLVLARHGNRTSASTFRGGITHLSLIQREGSVDQREMERTFNMGIGMVAVLPEDSVDSALATLQGRNVESWVCGHVRERFDGEQGDAAAKGGSGGAVTVVGEHR